MLLHRYTQAALEWAAWVNTVPSERYHFYRDTLYDQERRSSVDVELQKINCFNCILTSYIYCTATKSCKFVSMCIHSVCCMCVCETLTEWRASAQMSFSYFLTCYSYTPSFVRSWGNENYNLWMPVSLTIATRHYRTHRAAPVSNARSFAASTHCESLHYICRLWLLWKRI